VCGGGAKSNMMSVMLQQQAQQTAQRQFEEQMAYTKEQQAKSDARTAALDAEYAAKQKKADLTPAIDSDFESGVALTDQNDRLQGTKKFIIPLGKTPVASTTGLNVPA
jgi:maltodextrin utilization protein YvdJ